jgi:hypothetical protein
MVNRHRQTISGLNSAFQRRGSLISLGGLTITLCFQIFTAHTAWAHGPKLNPGGSPSPKQIEAPLGPARGR